MEEHENIKWIPIKNNCKTFQWEGEPELIHVIETGFVDKFMVVYEDAHQLNIGKTIYGTKADIEKKFNISLDDVKSQVKTIIVPPRYVKENGIVVPDITEEDKATLKLGIAIGMIISFFIAAIYNVCT